MLGKPGKRTLQIARHATGPTVRMYVHGPLDGLNEFEDGAPPAVWHEAEWIGGRRRHLYLRERLRAVTADGRAWWKYFYRGSADIPDGRLGGGG